jgi:hypothetical protein
MKLWEKYMSSIEREPPKKRDPQQLKILIVSTPKTGNTWLEYLLAAVYDLPIVELSWPLDHDTSKKLGPRWIAHQHCFCTSDLLNWSEGSDIVLLTTVRHPGDVLISLYHHVHRSAGQHDADLGPGTALMLADDSKIGEHTLSFVRDFFYILLNISVTWLYSEKSQIIRYEDMWRDPVSTLAGLTDQIVSVPLNTIERAVEQCDIQLLRRIANSNASFFRRGSIGSWPRELPQAIVELFHCQDPYPAQFTALGYNLEPDDPLIAAPASQRRLEHPFQRVSCFDNGVPVPPIAVRLYLSFDSTEALRRWPDVADTQSPDSFYAWMNAPSEQDPAGHDSLPIITNLAAYLYRLRYDVQQALPDIYGLNRIDWAFWFLRHAPTEYELDLRLMLPAQGSLIAWAAAVALHDRARGSSVPPITNLADYIYHLRPDVQAVYPELYGHHRVGYLLWFLEYAARDHQLDETFIQVVRELFLDWANVPDPDDPHQHTAALYMTRLAAHVYRQTSDLRRQYPDLYNKHRLDYLTWFVTHHSWIVGAVRPIISSWAQGYTTKRASRVKAPRNDK